MRVTRRAYAVDGWGTGELWLAGEVVVHHVLPGDAAPASTEPRLGPAPRNGGVRASDESVRDLPSSDSADFATVLCTRLSRHLAGEPVSYDDVTLELEWATPFQVELVAALRRVPWGEVVTYGELSALAGRPRAPRAAGALCAASPFALILPCHRVVAADGIGGYGRDGVVRKRRLLAIEGVEM